jgi:hypothetical protein
LNDNQEGMTGKNSEYKKSRDTVSLRTDHFNARNNKTFKQLAGIQIIFNIED